MVDEKDEKILSKRLIEVDLHQFHLQSQSTPICPEESSAFVVIASLLADLLPANGIKDLAVYAV